MEFCNDNCKSNMKRIKGKINYIYAFVGSFVTSLIMSWYSYRGIKNYEMECSKALILSCFYITAVWFSIMILYCVFSNINFSSGRLFVFVGILIILVYFLMSSFWNSGYLSLDPISEIIDGKENVDTLFYAAISGGIRSYGYPNLLVNGTKYINYHTLSNYVVAICACIFRTNTFLTYCFIIPIVFSSIFVFSLFAVCSRAKHYLSGEGELNSLDFIAICVSVLGLLPNGILSEIGIWKKSTINSESFLFSSIIIFIFLFILFGEREHKNDNSNIMIFFVIPLFIFLASFAKISTGALLLVFIISYLFQLHSHELKYWTAYIEYFAIFLLCYKLFSGTSLFQGFKWLPFIEEYGGGKQNLFLYLIISNIEVLIIMYNKLKNSDLTLLEFIINKEYAIVKSLLLLGFFSVIPGMIMPIGGGSAAYFAFCSSIFGIVFLVGYSLPISIVKIEKEKQVGSIVSVFLLVAVIYVMIYNSNILSFEKGYRVNNSKDINRALTFWNNIEEINKITEGKKQEYALYIDPSAEVLDIYNGSMKEAFVYPATTDLLCLNIVHEIDNCFYDVRDNIIAPSWNLFYGFSAAVPRENKRTLEEVVQALPANVKHIIVMENDCFRIVNME